MEPGAGVIICFKAPLKQALGDYPGKAWLMFHPRLRAAGRLIPAVVVALFVFLCLTAVSNAAVAQETGQGGAETPDAGAQAPDADAQTGDSETEATGAGTEAPDRGTEEWASSWLWDWSDPYQPETLLLWGGRGVFLRNAGKLREPVSIERQVILDLSTGSVRELALYRGVQTRVAVPITREQYGPRLTGQSLRTHWEVYGRRGLAAQAAEQAPIGTLKLELPVEIPKTIQKIIGRGKPNLRVSGSEAITISGRSTWEVDQKASEAGRQSKFPQLNLKQQLAVNVSGEIGDKINVDIDQNSQESLANRIRINYRGYEDEILQALDLGNTNLSLPGAQFVSYNGRHQGLFGVKANARLGDLDMTLIASKQEGQTGSSRFVGNSTVRTTNISDVSYAARTFYFMGDPREWPFTNDDDEYGSVDLTTLQVYLDDAIAQNDDKEGRITLEGKAHIWEGQYTVIETQGGDSVIVQTAPIAKKDDAAQGRFDLLINGQDYEIIFFYQDCPTIWLKRSLGDNEILAIAYEYDDPALGRVQVGDTDVAEGEPLDLRLLKAPTVDLATTTDGFYDPAGRFFPTTRYEMKNIYHLGSDDILDEGFDLTIYPKSGDIRDNDLDGTPYTQLLGLDRLDQNGLSAFNGGGADGEIDVYQGSVYLDLGLVVFPDLRPFDPDEVDLKFWRRYFFPEGYCRGGGGGCEEPYEEPLAGEDAVREIYDKKNIKVNEDTEYVMTVEFRSNLYGETIFLQGSIIEGSETVTANGQRLEKGRDYNIDYGTGTVTLISDVARESSADLAIDYSYKPLFALGQRTLLGFSSSYRPVDDYALSTTWIYESKGATERRAKLGEEPSLTVIGDVAGSMRKTPASLTRFVDMLPLISTDSPSSINLAGEIGMSFPNPNTENHGYVEDFEGTKDDLSLDLSRVRWFYSSVPDAIADPLMKAATRWYNPRDDRRVRADDLQPELTSVEADDSVESIEIDVDPGQWGSSSWAGLTQMVSSTGADFSQKQYIDFWVNDEFMDRYARDLSLNPDSIRIYIDVGSVSEDAMWDITAPPNGVLDTEDENGDQVLDDSEVLNEDTGLDGILSPQEIGPSQTGVQAEGDPNADDYDLDPDLRDENESKFLRINGTEDNDRLDTEDLNRNRRLDVRNRYYQYTVNLADSTSRFLLTEIEEVGIPTGWRRYRIPVKGGAVDTVGSPSLDSVEHVRIWFTGFKVRSRIQVAKMAFTGNRWTRQGVADTSGTFIDDQALDARGEKFLVGVVNNKEDIRYAPPFDPGEDGNIERREQSLHFSYQNLEPGHTGLAFRAFDPAKDFTLYREVKFYVYGDRTEPDMGFMVRFGDDKNYYQLEVPMTFGWQEVVVDLQALTSLKSPDIPDSMVTGNRTLSVVGNPSFTQIRRISAGIVNRGNMLESGDVWFNDVRLGEVRRDVGIASRLNMQMSLADFMNISGSYDGQDEDFLAIGQNRGSGIDRRRLSVAGKVNLHKLVAPLRLTFPVSFNWSENSSVPEFRTGDDRELLPDQMGDERSLSRNTSFSADIARAPSRNPLLRYTIDAMRASVQWRKNRSVGPVRADTTEVVTTRLRYDISPPQKRLGFIPGIDLAYLPSNFSVSFVTSAETRSSFDKDAGVQTKNVTLKPAKIQLDTGYRPVSSLSANYSLTSNRDLLRKRPVDFMGGLNIGSELNRQESVRASFSPRLFWWLGSPSFNYSGNYRENHNPSLTTEQDKQNAETRRTVNNSSNYRMGVNVPWGRFMDIVASAGSDTVSAASALGLTKALFGALGGFNNITVSRTVSDNSSYNGVYGVPDLRYKLGLTSDLGRESRPAPSAALSLGTSKMTEARTDGSLFKDYRVSVAYSREDRETENTSGKSFDRVISWPDVKFDVTGLESKLGLGDYLSRLTAQSAYAGRSTRNIAQGGRQKNVSEARNWRPLLSINAVLKGGLSTTFSANHGSEERTSFNANTSQSRTLTTTAYSFNLQKTIRGGEGVTLPFGRQTRTQRTINVTLNVTYNKNRADRQTGAGTLLVDADSDKFRAVTRGTYNFSSNMVGTLDLSFDQTRNMKTRRTIRGVAVNASVRLRF